jgi:hypothetical protein
MFGFVQWDDPLTLLLEVLLSLAIVAGLILVVRRVNARAAAQHAAGEPDASQREPEQSE